MLFTNIYEELFFLALKIRLVEEKVIELYPSDKIQSPVHLSIGQEAVAVGVCRSLTPSDLLFSSYRGHAFYMAKGGDLRAMFAELCGKVTGCCEGKGGSMHLAAPEVGMMGASAIVASTIPHAVGAALAAKLLKKEQVIVAVFGDGAVDEGVYHESLNIAALHALPVIFLFENNGLAVHSRMADRHSFNVLDHVKTYNIPVHLIEEGYDFVRVDQEFRKIVDLVRATSTPQFVEIRTYRYKEHVGVSDDFEAGYRSRQELEDWKANDPLVINQDLVNKFTPVIAAEIDDAVMFAEQSPWPGQSDLLKDVW